MRVALSTRHPSAMLSIDGRECFSTPPAHLERFSAIGVGPGLGRDPKTVEALGELLKSIITIRKSEISGLHTTSIPGEENIYQPPLRLVLDADALNIIAQTPEYKQLIPDNSILTPHPGELRRLVGDWKNDREKLEKASNLAREIRSIVIIKGAHSVICTSDGRFLFNSTGTPGMAKGGSGDVLTGLITGLIARGHDAETASIIGVYAHGKAGETAEKRYGAESMNPSDIAELLQID